MASTTKIIATGCTVSVPARRFDEPGEDRWSEEQFGAEADEKQLLCNVIGKVRGRWKVLVYYDDTSYSLEEAALTHDSTTCGVCWPKRGPCVPSTRPDVSGVQVVGHATPVVVPRSIGVCEAQPSSTSVRVADSARDASDDEMPLHRLARAAEEDLLQSPTPPSLRHSEGLGGHHDERALSPPIRRRGRPSNAPAPRTGAASDQQDERDFDVSDDDYVPDDDSSSGTDTGKCRLSEDSDCDYNVNVVGRASGRGAGTGTGPHRGRGGRGNRPPIHEETDTRIKRHNLWWEKSSGRSVDPMLSTGGYSNPPRLTLYNYTDKNELQFFEHCYPTKLVADIASATTLAGKQLLRPHWLVTEGELWLFLACKQYMMIFAQEGPAKQFWHLDDEEVEGTVFVRHDLGKYGLTFNRYREIERCFRLPHDVHTGGSDHLSSLKTLVDEWNENMCKAFVPGRVLTVDESMGAWLGRGMPGLMTVRRKPTPTGREAHTTACAISGLIVFYEIYEGKARMENKEFVDVAGKNPAKALRCVKPWFSTGRVVILDSGFASVKCALELMDKGLFMIGNIKSGSKQYPKELMTTKVPRRGMRYTCTTTAVSRGGLNVSLLAASDMDKQPMALLGTSGTSCDGETLHRRFTTIRTDGTFHVREADLEQMQIHEMYRKYFNALDKHNAIRQGGACMESSWLTHRWYIRDFQMLWGISEVNAWLLFKRFRPGNVDLSFTSYRKRLCYQMLRHPKWCQEMGLRSLNSVGLDVMVHHKPFKYGMSETGHPMKRCCTYCGHRTELICSCNPDEMIWLCSTNIRPECHDKHVNNIKPPNRRREGGLKRWASRGARQGGGRAGRAVTY